VKVTGTELSQIKNITERRFAFHYVAAIGKLDLTVKDILT
jgi:hypothetical protein